MQNNECETSAGMTYTKKKKKKKCEHFQHIVKFHDKIHQHFSSLGRNTVLTLSTMHKNKGHRKHFEHGMQYITTRTMMD